MLTAGTTLSFQSQKNHSLENSNPNIDSLSFAPSDTLNFDQKIYFEIKLGNEIISSHFYVSTKNGNIALDAKSYQQISHSSVSVFEYWVKFPNNTENTYFSQNGHRYFSSTDSEQSIIQDIELTSNVFKNDIFSRIIQAAKPELKHLNIKIINHNENVNIELLKTPEIKYDARFKNKIAGFWGLGYTAGPDSMMYLIQSYEFKDQYLNIVKVEKVNLNIYNNTYTSVLKKADEQKIDPKIDSIKKIVELENLNPQEITIENDRSLKMMREQRSILVNELSQKYGYKIDENTLSSDIGTALKSCKFSEEVINIFFTDVMYEHRKAEIALNNLKEETPEKLAQIQIMLCMQKKRKELLNLKDNLLNINHKFAKKKKTLAKEREILVNKFNADMAAIAPICN